MTVFNLVLSNLLNRLEMDNLLNRSVFAVNPSTWILEISTNQSELDTNSNISTTAVKTYNLYEQPILREVRLAVLWILALTGLIGNGAVLFWLLWHRKRRSKVLRLFLNLAISDTLVLAFATCSQLAWEYVDRDWKAGDVFCRVFKFAQTFSICASNYLIVAIALDRHRAIRRPLAIAWKVNVLGGGSWLMAAVINSPILFIFKQSRHNGKLVCRNTLYDLPPVMLRMYLTAVVVLVFIAPLIAISICYLQIFRKIAEKAREGCDSSDCNNGSDNEVVTGLSRLRARKRKFTTPRASNTSLPKAKIKTLKMTLVIITSFLVCSAPYCIVEMWRVYGDYKALDATTYSILAALAVSNSSTNPFVFLSFHFASGGQRRTARPQITSQSALLRNYCCYCCQGCSFHRNTNPNWADAPSEYKETLSTDGMPLDRLTSNSSTQIVTFVGDDRSQKKKQGLLHTNQIRVV